MPAVVTIRNDTVPGDGGEMHVHLRPTVVACGRPDVLLTGGALAPGHSVTVEIEPHTHIVITEAPR
jgi:hypothetical protein